jgi:Spy/CpxP family protein refolding chaperone
MKTNKLILLTALALGCLIAVNAGAQEKPNRPPGQHPAQGGPNGEQAGPRRGNIAEQLNLTAEQKPKVEAIMKEAGNKRKALREDTSLTPEQRREKAQALQAETKAKLKDVLTAEQLTKFEEMAKNRRGQNPGGGPGGPGGGEGQGPRKGGGAPANN